MIDFANATYAKLSPRDPADAFKDLGELLVPGESIVLAFKGARDSVTLTDKRLIALNVQGMTGKKKDWTSLPYSKIQAFSVESAGTFDLDSELEMWLSGLGRVRLEFSRGVDIRMVGRFIAERVL